MSGDPGQYEVDHPAVRSHSRQLQQGGHQASQAMNNGVNSYGIGGGNSKTGKAIHVIMAGSRHGVEHTPGETSDGGQQNDDSTNGALDGMENLDAQNAALVKGASMDPDSIDQDAQKEAKDMLNGDQTDQQMEKILEQMMGMGTQAAQQVSQQFNQLFQQLSQGMNQVVDQISKAASQAASQAASHAAGDALNAAGALGDGLGGAGAGAGAGTIPAGLEEPVTPMTTSPALVQNTGPVAAAAAPAGAAGARPPMMPMMPMHGGKGDKDKRKRNPNLFPEGRIYEPPTGTVQNFGANPEIDAEAPPFGTSKSA